MQKELLAIRVVTFMVYALIGAKTTGIASNKSFIEIRILMISALGIQV